AQFLLLSSPHEVRKDQSVQPRRSIARAMDTSDRRPARNVINPSTTLIRKLTWVVPCPPSPRLCWEGFQHRPRCSTLAPYVILKLLFATTSSSKQNLRLRPMEKKSSAIRTKWSGSSAREQTVSARLLDVEIISLRLRFRSMQRPTAVLCPPDTSLPIMASAVPF